MDLSLIHICFVVLLVADPANAFWGLLAILTGGLSDMKNLGQVLYAATPIIPVSYTHLTSAPWTSPPPPRRRCVR